MSTKFQTIRQEPLTAVIETRTALLHAASQLSLEAQDTVFLGVWSVVDLIAHLVGWDFTNLAAAKDIQAGKLPGFYAHYDKDWKTYNAELVAKYKRDDFEELLVGRLSCLLPLTANSKKPMLGTERSFTRQNCPR
jgi:hypothetical protein